MLREQLGSLAGACSLPLLPGLIYRALHSPTRGEQGFTFQPAIILISIQYLAWSSLFALFRPTMVSSTHDDYTIAWICTLPLEVAAARVMLNRTHSPLPNPSTDSNAYELGELDGHYIVITCLPAGVYGIVAAANVVSRMRSTFPRLQYGLMVGIGGGVPGKNNNIQLGDVVVSKPFGQHSRVIQYNYGKTVKGGRLEPTGALNKPPQTLLTHMSQLEAKRVTRSENDLSKIMEEALKRNPNIEGSFSPPEQLTDFLFESSYHHIAGKGTCEMCDKEQLVKRKS